MTGDSREQSQEQTPLLNIIGEKVALGPLRRDLLPSYVRWVNDFEVSLTLAGWWIQTAEKEEEWLDRALKERTDVNFTIYERATLRPIGATSLMSVDHRHRLAEFGILIGEKECWGKGYGTEVARLVLDFGFTALNLHNIMLRVFSFNKRGLRAYAKAGFREIGRRREAFWAGDRVYDEVQMDCLSTEFESPVLKKMLPEEEHAVDHS